MIIAIATNDQNMDSDVWYIVCHGDDLPIMSSVSIHSKMHFSDTFNTK